MLYTPLAVLALAATTLAVSGCGKSSSTASSKPLTRAELIAQADVICKRFYTELHAHGSSTAQDLAHNVPLLATYEQTEGTELSKLTPPSNMSADWKQIVAGTQTLAGDTLKASHNLKNPKALDELIVAGQKVQQQTFIVAKRDGFGECSRPA